MFPKYLNWKVLLGTIGVLTALILTFRISSPEKIPSLGNVRDHASSWAQEHMNRVRPNRNYTHSVVVASTTRDDTSWVNDPSLSDIEKFIYIADNSSAPYHPPVNKGRETIMYMTHVIDHYDNLTDVVSFVHFDQKSWHNNELFDNDMVQMLKMLRLSHVNKIGFFNLRCHPELGCPAIPFEELGHMLGDPKRNLLKATWEDFYGPDAPPYPTKYGAACCAQFAATRDSLRRASRDRWIRWRDWLMTTTLPDGISGRIWEYTWHHVLSGNPIHCPDVRDCYCEGYGVCFDTQGDLDAVLGMKETMFFGDQLFHDLIKKPVPINEIDKAALAKDIDDTGYHVAKKLGDVVGNRIHMAIVRGKQIHGEPED